MYSRWYSVAVVILWLTTMSWLVVRKVLPAMLVGEPPDAMAILGDGRDEPPCGWSMRWNDEELGWALNTTSRRMDDSIEVRSRVHFDNLPLSEMLPGWLKSVLEPFGKLGDQLNMETESILVFDPQGNLSWFESSVQFQPGVKMIEVRGVIEGSLVSINIHAGEFKAETELALPAQAMLGDAISPQTRLPGLYRGQTWTVKLYSPLRPPSRPMEVLQAEVEEIETIEWNGRLVETWLVTYRSDPGSVLGDSDKPRQRLWVQPDGTVLKQQATFLDSTITFVRLSDAQANMLAEMVSAEIAEPGVEGMSFPTLRSSSPPHPASSDELR